MRKCKVLTVLLGISSFFIGGGLYLLYRSESLRMFTSIKAMGMYDLVSAIRPHEGLDCWIIYSLPDGLWLFSYILLMAALWNFDTRNTWLYSTPLVVIAIGSEILQIPHIVSGTFDWVDLLCYLGATLLGYVYIKIINNHLNRIKQ